MATKPITQFEQHKRDLGGEIDFILCPHTQEDGDMRRGHRIIQLTNDKPSVQLAFCDQCLKVLIGSLAKEIVQEIAAEQTKAFREAMDKAAKEQRSRMR